VVMIAERVLEAVEVLVKLSWNEQYRRKPF
jgi:hypothetical protein